MIYLKPLRLWTTMYIVVLLNLTGIMYQIFVKADPGDYHAFLTSSNTDELSPEEAKEKMAKMEGYCNKDLLQGLMRLEEDFNVTDFSLMQVREIRDQSTDLFYFEIPELRRMNTGNRKLHYNPDEGLIILFPGYRTDIADATNKIFSRLVWTLKKFHRNKNIFVLNVGQHFNKWYTYEQCIVKIPLVARYLGENLARTMPYLVKHIHFIGVDLGASIAGQTARFYYLENAYKISRITAINPLTPCLEEFLKSDSADFVDVYYGSNFYNETTGTLGAVNFEIRNRKDKSSCSRIPCSSLRALLYYTDSVLSKRQKKKYKLMACPDGVCGKEKYKLQFGYQLKKEDALTYKPYQILYAKRNIKL